MANHKLTNHVLELGAGTVSAPSVTLGDAGTGFYRPAENQIAVTVDGAQMLLIQDGAVSSPAAIISGSFLGSVVTGADAEIGSSVTGDADTAKFTMQKANDGGAATVDADNLGNIVFNGTNGVGDPVVAAQISAYQKGAQDTECPGGLVISSTIRAHVDAVSI